MAKIQVKFAKSTIGRPDTQKRTIKALGFRKLQQVKVFEDTPAVRGMINKVSHLLEVVEL